MDRQTAHSSVSTLNKKYVCSLWKCRIWQHCNVPGSIKVEYGLSGRLLGFGLWPDLAVVASLPVLYNIVLTLCTKGLHTKRLESVQAFFVLPWKFPLPARSETGHAGQSKGRYMEQENKCFFTDSVQRKYSCFTDTTLGYLHLSLSVSFSHNFFLEQTNVSSNSFFFCGFVFTC